MPFFIEDLYQFVAYVNRGDNGFTETWNLLAEDEPSARAAYAAILPARRSLLADGHQIIWAGLRRQRVRPEQLGLLANPLDSLRKPDESPYWGPVDFDGTSLQFVFETATGKAVDRYLLGVPDDEITGERWVRAPWTAGKAAISVPADPGAAAPGELYLWALRTLRDYTCHARLVGEAGGGSLVCEVEPWDVVHFVKTSIKMPGRRFLRSSWEAYPWDYSPGFSPCGSVVGCVRSCYTAPCYFFGEGPARTIRHYVAYSTALLFPLWTIYWPWSQELQHTNTSPPGEKTGATARAWANGYSLGDAAGTDYCGTPAQFLGLSSASWDTSLATPEDERCECDMPVQPFRIDNSDGSIIEADAHRLTVNLPNLKITKPAAGHVVLEDDCECGAPCDTDCSCWSDEVPPGSSETNSFNFTGNGPEMLCGVTVPGELVDPFKFSMTFWAKFDTAVSMDALCAGDRAILPRRLIGIGDGAGNPQLYFQIALNNGHYYTSIRDIVGDVHDWNFYAIVWDGSAALPQLRYFVNAVECLSITLELYDWHGLEFEPAMAETRIQTYTGYPFVASAFGTDFRIFNGTTLTPLQITNLMAFGTESGLSHWFKLNEGSGLLVADSGADVMPGFVKTCVPESPCLPTGGMGYGALVIDGKALTLGTPIKVVDGGSFDDR